MNDYSPITDYNFPVNQMSLDLEGKPYSQVKFATMIMNRYRVISGIAMTTFQLCDFIDDPVFEMDLLLGELNIARLKKDHYVALAADALSLPISKRTRMQMRYVCLAGVYTRLYTRKVKAYKEMKSMLLGS
jgi:hypothetical protein